MAGNEFISLNIPEKTYRCGRGHTVKLNRIFNFVFRGGGVDIDTGPLCPICIQQELAKFGTSEVVGDCGGQEGPVEGG
jgi:hypothetical protein